MSTVGQKEKKTQERVVKRFRVSLGYYDLGDWSDRAGNSNSEPQLGGKAFKYKERGDTVCPGR